MIELKNYTFNFNCCCNELVDALTFLLNRNELRNQDILDMFDPNHILESDYPPIYYARDTYIQFVLEHFAPDTIVRVVNQFIENRTYKQGDVVEYVFRTKPNNEHHKGIIISVENDGPSDDDDDDDTDIIVVLDEFGNTDLFYLTEADHEIKKTGEHVDILGKLFNKESK